MSRIVLVAALLVAPSWAQDAKKDYCSDDDAKAHIEACKKEYKAKNDEDHLTYIDKLGEKKNLKILEVLTHFLGKGSADVQIAAGKEIGKYRGEAKASEALVNAAKAASARKDGVELTKKFLFQVGEIAHRPHAKQLPPFWGQKMNLDICTEAVSATGKLRSKDSVDPLLALFREVESIKEEKAANIPGGPGGGAPPPPAADDEKLKRRSLIDPIISALHDITQNANKPRSCKEWEEWWRKNKSSFKEQPE